jgi:GNAT superfamily N-acetyltransferase
VSTHVRQATVHDLDVIAPLFDGYRQFYGQPPDLSRARAFLHERFAHQESILFIALTDTGAGMGFTQLFPSFSSTQAARIFILNDLFVVAEARGKGVATALLHEAARFGRAAGAVGLVLQTAHTNTTAQKLYEAQGWVRDLEYREYALSF